jgi:hypothetical protein
VNGEDLTVPLPPIRLGAWILAAVARGTRNCRGFDIILAFEDDASGIGEHLGFYHFVVRKFHIGCQRFDLSVPLPLRSIRMMS